MNSAFEDETLDAVLNQLSERSVSPEHLNSLRDRIVSSTTELTDADFVDPAHAAAKVRLDRTELTTNSVQHLRNNTRSTWASATALATVVVMLLLLGLGLWQLSPPDAASASEAAPACAWMQDEELRNKNHLLSEMENLFHQQLAWVAETGKRLEFGLHETAVVGAERPGADERLAVRVVVQQRKSDRDNWQLAWSMDVVSRNEDVVRVQPAEADGNELQLWTYRLPDGSIAVDSELQLSGTNAFRTRASGLHQNADPVKVVSAHSNGTEYRVFQTVAVLDEKVI